jgi:hypothetical protein
MKVHMTSQVGQTKDTMFNDCVNHVRSLIDKLLKGTREQLLEKVDAVYLAIEREYTSVVIGQDTGSSGALPREQRVLRKNVLEIVDSADLKFQQAVGLAPPDEDGKDEKESSAEPDEDRAESEAVEDIAAGTELATNAAASETASALQVERAKATSPTQDIVANAQQAASLASSASDDDAAFKAEPSDDDDGVKIEEVDRASTARITNS